MDDNTRHGDQPDDPSAVLASILRRRRMHRNFETTAVDPQLLDDVLDLARRAPSAGHTQATEFVVLRTPEATARYWDTTLPSQRREGFRWQGLMRAPVLVLVCTRPSGYLERYSEPDKAKTERGAGTSNWPVPYWWFDAGAAAENLLLLATAHGLGACLFGPFDHEDKLRENFSINADRRIAAVVALGYPLPDEEGRSVTRGWRSATDVIRYIDR